MVGEGDEMYHWCELGDNCFYGDGNIACNATLHNKIWDAGMFGFVATAGFVKNTYWVVT